MVMTGMLDEQGQRLVILPGLRRAAAAFGTQSATFRSIMPPSGPASVDSGSTEFDRVLTLMLEAIGALPAQQSASSLAPFAKDWVGGDISGWQALATTLYGYEPDITGTVTALNGQVSQLTAGGEGRPGPAASAFTTAWRRDSITADALAAVIGQTASIVDRLAAELAMIENALQEEAYAASRYGVKIGTDGRPPPVSAGPPADPAAASEQHWALTYQQVHEQAMADARQARQQAASQLMDLYAMIGPPQRPLGTSGLPEAGSARSCYRSLIGKQALSHAVQPPVVKGVWSGWPTGDAFSANAERGWRRWTSRRS